MEPLLAKRDEREHERRTSGFKVEKLAAVTGRSPESLMSITYFHPEQPRGCRARHDLVLTELDLTHPKLCPACVKEQGFVEAYWDLSHEPCPPFAARAVP